MSSRKISTRNLALTTGLLVSMSFNASVATAQTNSNYTPKATQLKPQKAQAFSAENVRLLENGIFKESQDAEARNILSLNPDRLLAPYLKEAGLMPKASLYPGWETGVLPGVALGFYLSGVSRLYMATGQQEYASRLSYVLDQLASCQEKNGGEFLLGTANGRKNLERVEKEGFYEGFGRWGGGEATPYYSMEKLLSGLRDVYRITHNNKALNIASNLGNWVAKHMANISDLELQQLMKIEYGGMNWVLSDLYADTGDKRFLALSKRWQDTITVEPATKGIDKLTGVHGNMQFPKFSGLAARYPYSGNAADLKGAEFFWSSVVNHRSYVTGGNTEDEFFGPRDKLSKTLTPFNAENCNEYNMLRLTSLLYQIEPKVEYADYIERTLYNHVLATQNPADGKLTYQVPLVSGGEKVYQPLDFFSCCTASALDSYTRHAEYIYARTESALFVNLFVPSKVDFQVKGISLVQETSFPDNNISTLTLNAKSPVDLDLCIRNPYWANNGVVIKVNGKVQKKISSKNGYFHLNRKWRNGDKVEIILPMQLRTESMPDDKNMIAIFYGPVLLAASLDNAEADALVNRDLAPALLPANAPLTQWLKPTGASLTFTTLVAKPKQFTLTPFYRKKTGKYAVYWQTLTESEWAQREADASQNQGRVKNLDLATLDKVSAGDNAGEDKHGLIGGSTIGYGNGGILTTTCWRTAAAGEFHNSFGYSLAVSDTEPNILYCNYMGRFPYEKWDCKITVEGTTIATLKRGKDVSYSTRLWDATYSIPQELTKGRKMVRVMFEPFETKDVAMPRLVEMRILKQKIELE